MELWKGGGGEKWGHESRSICGANDDIGRGEERGSDLRRHSATSISECFFSKCDTRRLSSPPT